MPITDLADFHAWFADRRAAHRYSITPARLDALDGWRIVPETGDIRHSTGRFFSVEGLEVDREAPVPESWSQPIIRQPETGILGLLVKRFGGVPHLLLQAKMEPGNINTIQLSPTVQATFSNYTRVHRGGSVPYIEHFLAPRRGQVRHDALQSEQGSWFLGKRNRNIIVETTDEIPFHEDFCWIPQDLLPRLLRVENLINMDTRTVLAGLPSLPKPPHGRAERPLHDTTRLLHWFTEAKVRHRLHRRRIPMNEVKGWHLDPAEIAHEDGRYFRIIGVDVEADNREVTSWSQPMLAPRGRGVIAFLGKDIGGVRHLLVRARSEAGTLDAVELGPTVQCGPGNLPQDGPRPAFLDAVLSAPAERVLFDTVHSEEGGRFYHAENRYLLVDATGTAPDVGDVPEDFVWMSVRQLTRAARLGGVVNVEARTLLACVHSLGEESGA